MEAPTNTIQIHVLHPFQCEHHSLVSHHHGHQN